MSKQSNHPHKNTPLVAVNSTTYSVQNKTIISDVTFQVEAGEIRAIVGPNGAGKSTLVRCIAGVLKKTGGSICFGGEEQHTLSRREMARLVCYIPQVQSSLPAYTVRQFIGMGRYAHNGFWQAMRQGDVDTVNAAMEITGVHALEDRLLPTLSGGERQMVTIAAGVAQEAEVLILDEPATFLDPAHQDRLLDILLRLNSEKSISLIIVTHDINMASFFTHQTLGLRGGKVIFDGMSADILDQSVLYNIFGTDFELLPMGTQSRRLAVSRKYAL